MCALGTGRLLTTAVLHLPLIAVIGSLLTMVSGVAVTSAPATSLALANYPDIAGTASSLLGLARFAFGGLAAFIAITRRSGPSDERARRGAAQLRPLRPAAGSHGRRLLAKPRDEFAGDRPVLPADE